MKELLKPIIFFLVIFGVALTASIKYCDYKEDSCAKKCLRLGAKNYTYQGFSGNGYRSSLKGDSCSCIY